MKKKMLLLPVVVCLSLPAAFAQTKRIAHRSHGGSNATFHPLAGKDNFGLDNRRFHRQDSIAATQRDTVVVSTASSGRETRPKKAGRKK